MFYVTWSSDICDAGSYFLTFVEGSPDMPINVIMEKAHECEGFEMDTYEVCSIIYVSPEAHDGETQVIY